MYKTKQTARRTFPPLKPPNFKAPVPRESSYSDSYSHESCPTSSCDSCFGYIYDNGYDSNTEEWDDDDEEDDDDDETQSSACQSQVTDPFSMSSMSSLFGPPSFSSQQPHGFALGAPSVPPSLPSTSRGKERAQQSRCSCQKISKGYCNATSGAPSGNNGQNQSPNITETQLSIFSNNGQSGTNSQTQTTDNQALGHLLGDGRSATADVKDKNGNGTGNGNGMIKNLNVYNPNITIQVTPENFNRFSKFFPQKSGNAGNGK
ncbi:hypothetical protein GE21DRAFT_7170 [Neurospora crassa]|uniref:Uncharacterized protein n=2 Tax=Neurospora crassa TaxID=5141 RepID=Q1K7S3_NEUCR|nr:hypothetical protein NCU03599 [Neurospora crassa OR74A]EAA32090.1 hypothetical protein NCU03599 [Neurospora crassa OR74A]KHE88808.1 hypothetical protein GE21DRAFT_7170 [Neurospora crassa]CAD21275.1 hypothetical protein [Neurospora crassa]|eukprot:XP_961326.1 hypothetical protein NCU03599 [Neurospora crassa OR74A]